MHFRGMLLLVMAFNGQASELLSDKVTLFEVKPKVCIVKKIGQECHFKTTVQWQTQEVMEVCLAQRNKVLQCWKNQLYISEKMAIVLHQSTEVFLVDADNDKLASEMLEVNAVNPKKQRRRLRSAWSLF
jgi:hypothetical protein